MTTNVVYLESSAFDLSSPDSLRLDLANPKPKEVLALVEAIEAHVKANPDLGRLPVKTGWHEITPALAVELICRNRPGANRRVDPGTVFYYANQMARGEWQATGQPIIFNDEGALVDAQHRLLGGIIAGASFRSFVVTDVKAIPNLFAYIDNSRARNGATALQTAGFNGVAPLIVKVVRIGEDVRHGVYSPSTGLSRLPRLSPPEMLALIKDYPNAQKASRSASSDWSTAVDFIGRKDVVAYFGMRLIDLYGEEFADDFFEELVDTSKELPVDHPIGALRKLVEKNNRDAKPMKRQYLLAALIKSCNAWQKGEQLGRRWMLQVNEDFPAFETLEREAAE